jgi:hypothetical protein
MGLMRNGKHRRPVLEGIDSHLPSNEQPLDMQSFTDASCLGLSAKPIAA